MGWAWLIPALCFIAFPLIVFFGRFTPKKGAFISIGAVAAGFILFWIVMVSRVNSGATGSTFFNFDWFTVGNTTLQWGMVIDPLTIVMLGLVTLVALCVQIYSLGYMHGDPRFGLYFAEHSLFTASMLTLVLSNNLLLVYIAWELVGLCSYLLIGFWWEKRSAAEAAKKAFITTRLGDVGLLVGVLLLFFATEPHTFNLQAIFHAIEHGEISSGILTASAFCIFFGAMGKSAQFPLHVWLPDAMEGPSPVSALIHAATMVAAGVFLVARTFPLFEAAPGALVFVATIGLITTLAAGGMSMVVTDLKRILAYSTVSHLGLMMLALGAGGLTAGILHLLTHGVSKALLFLGAGSVMHAMHGELDIRKMGGLRKVMPITAYTFLIGALSLAGIPVLAGFFSKDEMLVSTMNRAFGLGHYTDPSPIFILYFVLLLVAVFISAFYMARAIMVPFFGAMSKDSEHAHESPPSMAMPLILLAGLATVVGFIAIPWFAGYEGFGSFLFFEEAEHFHINWGLAIGSTVIALGAIGLAYAIYIRKSLSTEAFINTVPSLHKFLVNKLYLDDLYQWAINNVALVFARFIALFDRAVINDVAVNVPANQIRASGGNLRYHITGRVYDYALGVVIGAVAIAVAWWIIAS
jgi:NADH-quinone oxidoreductase subunit L